MAMKTQSPQAPAPEPAAEKGLSRRTRWARYGPNVAVSIVLATIALVMTIWLSGRLLHGVGRSDWTAGGRYSVSDRTRQILAGLSADFRLTSLYVAVPDDPESEEQTRRTYDLLLAYEGLSRHVKAAQLDPLVDPAGVDALVRRLKERYQTQLQRPQELAEQFQTLYKEVTDELMRQADVLAGAAQEREQIPENLRAGLLNFAAQLDQRVAPADQVHSVIGQMLQAPLPAYSRAISLGRGIIQQFKALADALPEAYASLRAAAGERSLPGDLDQLLKGAGEKLQPLVERMNKFLEDSADVEPTQLEQLSEQIGEGNVILVEGPDAVRVVPFDEVWPLNPDRGQEGAPERVFAGDSALSTVVWSMVAAEKPAILFVTAGSPATGYGGPFGRIAERLRNANFIVEDWDLMRDPELPMPENANRVVLVLTPPAPMNPQRPMPPPGPEAYAAAIDAIRSDGVGAIVLGQPTQGFSPALPYADLFDAFGLELKSDAMCVYEVTDALGNPNPIPQIEVTDYAASPITAPLNQSGLASLFLQASPVMLKEQATGDLDRQPLATLPVGRNYWAETSLMELMMGQKAPERDPATDIIPTAESPVPLAVAVTRRLGRPAEAGEAGAAPEDQRAVFLGDSNFVTNEVMRYQFRFPGNADLFVNSALWIAGETDLITVSPEAARTPTVGNLGGWNTAIGVLLVAGLPVTIAAIGALVLVLRRR